MQGKKRFINSKNANKNACAGRAYPQSYRKYVLRLIVQNYLICIAFTFIVSYIAYHVKLKSL